VDDPNPSRADPATPMLGGTGSAYWLDLRAYYETAAAKALDRPILILQGGRDFNVTIADDLAVWQSALAGRKDVTFHQYPRADHLFVDGDGPATPADYDHPGHVETQVITDIAAWVTSIPPRR
jgi:dienelactone hydrolase